MLDGPRGHVTGPQDLTSVLVAPAWREGCALLPQGLLLAELGAGKATLTQSAAGALLLDRAAGLAKAPALVLNPSGLPLSLSWQDKRGDPVVVTYGDYLAGPGAAHPATVTETVAGKTRLQIRLTSFSAHPGFSDSDFPVPTMP
ncbi:MAG TPA: hypothetical protein VFP94_04745, partial [Terriglobales bacterium]|nr:hypothetical protein [Terriglobales bacterium]